MITTTTTPNRKGRRLMKMAGGAVVLGVLATTGCAPSERTTASPAPAQPTASLAPGDTSRGADNFYTSDRVTVQKVTFKNQYQMNVTGNLFVPNDLDRNTKNAAMVVGHPMGAVKEQSANLYATKLAERGFVTLSLDLSYWGESEGQPRNLVAPDVYTEDFSAAVDYLRTQSFVDTERIGALGVCGSGSFVISAAKIDPRIKAVATVSMYDMGGVNRNGLRGAMTPEMRQEALALAAQQRDVEFTGGETEYVGGTPFELDRPVNGDRPRVLRLLPHRPRQQPRHHHPAHAEQQRAIHELLPVRRHRDDLSAPHAVHHRRSGPLPRVQRTGLPTRRRTKATGVVPGAGHVDLYDRVDLIPFDTLATFFQNNLDTGE